MVQVQLSTLQADVREAIDGEDFERAAAGVLRGLRRYPRWVEGYWMLGRILVDQDHGPEAQKCFDAVASALPDDPRPYQGLAAVAEQTGNHQLASAALFRSMELGETSQLVRGEYIRIRKESGSQADVVTTYARLAHSELLLGRLERADHCAEKALIEEDGRLDILLLRSVVHMLNHDTQSALRYCNLVLAQSPDCLKALAIARFVYRHSDRDHADQLEKDLDALDPERQMLVWLYRQLKGHGYDVSWLPTTPRVIVWDEEEAKAQEAAAGQNSLASLIPDLEQVWPEWLKQMESSSPVSEPVGAMASAQASAEADLPPVSSGPSFFGDIDALTRDFQAAAPATPTSPYGRPAPVAPPTMGSGSAGSPWDTAAASPAASPAASVQAFVPAPVSPAIPSYLPPSSDVSFGPATVPSRPEPRVLASAPVRSEPAVSPAPTASVEQNFIAAQPEPPAPPMPAPAASEPVLQVAPEPPAAVATDASFGEARQRADRAAAAGDYLAAIQAYGDALAALAR